MESYKTVSLVDLVCSNETAQNAEKPMNLGNVCNCEMECPLYWSEPILPFNGLPLVTQCHLSPRGFEVLLQQRE